MDDIQTVFFAFLQLIGVGLAVFGIIIGSILGRHAIKLTGGGLVEVTVTYLLIAAYLYLLQYTLRFIGYLLSDNWINILGSIVLFGTGICFFQIFWHLGEHMKRLETLAED